MVEVDWLSLVGGMNVVWLAVMQFTSDEVVRMASDEECRYFVESVNGCGVDAD
jgi:hypothetical protein